MTPDVRDIITTFAADGRSPQETAEALSLYREDVYDSIKEEAGPNVRDAWAATEGLNADIQEGLDALRDSSILSFVDQKIPDAATQNEFWTQIKNEQPIDGRFGVTEQDLAGVTNNPTFRLKSDSTAPTNVDAGQRRLFSYQIRPRQNETFEALVSSPERGDMLLSFSDPKPEQIDEMAVKLEETRKQNARDVLGVDIRAGADYTDLGDEDVETLALQEGPSNLSAEDTAARRDAQQQLRITMAKLAALRGPQGRDFARNELLVERMKQDDMIDFVGGRDVGNYLTDIGVGLSMFGLGTAQTAAMATGNEDEARGLARLNRDIQETTGSFGVEFSGGTLQRSVRGAGVSVGMMAPALALGPAGRLAGMTAGAAETAAIGSLAPATYSLAYNESMQEADALEQQGRLEEAQKIRNRSSIRAVADTVFELGVERINPFFSQVGAAGWARRLPKQVFQEAIVEEPLTLLAQQEVSNRIVDRPSDFSSLPETVLSAAIATTGTQAVTGVVSSMLPKTPQPMASEVTPADVTRNVAAAASGMPVQVNPQAIRPQDAGAVTAATQTNPETLAAVVAMTTNTTPVVTPQNAPVAPPTPAPAATPFSFIDGQGDTWARTDGGWTLTSKNFSSNMGVEQTMPMTESQAIGAAQYVSIDIPPLVAPSDPTAPTPAPVTAPPGPTVPASATPAVTPPEIVAGVEELSDAEALAIDAELGINPDLGTGEFSERDAMRIIGQEQPAIPTPNEQNQTPPIQQEQSSGQNVPQPRRMPLLSEVQDAPQPQTPPITQPASAQSGLTAIPAQTQTQEGLLAPTVAPSPEGAAISPQPPQPNAQNQIQETGGTPAIQGVPTVSQPEVQTQAGTAQRSGQGQEVVRDATKPEQMTPEEFTSSANQPWNLAPEDETSYMTRGGAVSVGNTVQKLGAGKDVGTFRGHQVKTETAWNSDESTGRFVIEDGGKVVASIKLNRDRTVEHLAVSPEYRASGMANALLDAADQFGGIDLVGTKDKSRLGGIAMHRWAINKAIANKEPVSVAAVEQYQMPRPIGYKQQGEMFVPAQESGRSPAPQNAEEESGAKIQSAPTITPERAALNAVIPEESRAAWTPEELAAAETFLQTQDPSAIAGLSFFKRLRVLDALDQYNPEALTELEREAIIETPQYTQEWLQEQVEQARAEGVQAGDTVVAQDEAGETIIGTVAATTGETTTVSTTSGNVTVPTAGLVRQAPQSLSRKPGLAQALMESDGAALQLGISQQDVERGIAATRRQIPGASNIWSGTRQAFLDTFGNDPAVQDMVQQLEEGVMTEGFYVPSLQRGFLFTDSVVVYQGDADRAALNGTTPAVEAAKRLIRHEVGGHGGWMTLTQKQQQQFMDIARDVIPVSDMNQMIEDGYPFQDWQTDEEIYRQAAEEWFSQRIGRMDKLPETGPMARFVDWLKGVWRWLTGRKGDPDLDAIKNLWRQIRMNQAAMATGRAWYSLPRQGSVQQLNYKQDAEYLAGVESGDIPADVPVYGPDSRAELTGKFGIPSTLNGPTSRVLIFWDEFNDKMGAVVVLLGRTAPVTPVGEREMNDRRYRALVESYEKGNPVLPEIQRMVDEAAKAAGYGVSGVGNGITYEPGEEPDSTYGERDNVMSHGGIFGFYFSDNPAVWNDYAKPRRKGEKGRVNRVSLSIERPFRFSEEFVSYGDLQARLRVGGVTLPADVKSRLDRLVAGGFGDTQPVWKWIHPTHVGAGASYGKSFQKAFTDAGYDGVIHPDSSLMEGGLGTPATSYVVFRPNQIKSADPVTYDEQGNPVPLSQRFQSTSSDIRYSRVRSNAEIASAIRQQATLPNDPQTASEGKVIRDDVAAQFEPSVRQSIQQAPPHELFSKNMGVDKGAAILDTLMQPERDPSKMAEMTPAEIEQRGGDVELNLIAHEEAVRRALVLGDAVSSSALARYGIPLPTGYRKFGELSAPVSPSLIRAVEFLTNQSLTEEAGIGMATTIYPYIAYRLMTDIANTITTAKSNVERVALSQAMSRIYEATSGINSMAGQRLGATGIAQRYFGVTAGGVMALVENTNKEIQGRIDASVPVDDLVAEINRLKAEIERLTAEESGDQINADTDVEVAEADMLKQEGIAESIIEEIANRLGDAPVTNDVERKEREQTIRDLHLRNVRQGMTEQDFIREAATFEVYEGLASRLWNVGNLEREARATIKAAIDGIRRQEIAESRASRLIYSTEERLRQGFKDLDTNTSGDSINKAFRDQIKTPVSLTDFKERLSKLSVGGDVAERLFRTAEREKADLARMDELLAKRRQENKEQRQIEIAQERASQLIYGVEEQLRQGSKDRTENAAKDTINKAFRDQVANPVSFEQFRVRLRNLRVNDRNIERMFATAERERIDLGTQQMMRDRANLLESESPHLAAIIRRIKDRIAPGISWRDLMVVDAQDGQERIREIYRRVRKHEALRNLSPAEAVQLSNALNRHFLKAKEKVLRKELQRVGAIGTPIDPRVATLFEQIRQGKLTAAQAEAEIQTIVQQSRWKTLRKELPNFLQDLAYGRVTIDQFAEKLGRGRKASDRAMQHVIDSTPKLIQAMNLGAFNAQAFRDAVSEQFGLKVITSEQAREIQQMVINAQKLQPGLPRDKAVTAIIDRIADYTSMSGAEIFNSFWVSSVLSGGRTQFDTWMNQLNAMRRVLQLAAWTSAKRVNQGGVSIGWNAITRYFEVLPGMFQNALYYLWSGDSSLLLSEARETDRFLNNGQFSQSMDTKKAERLLSGAVSALGRGDLKNGIMAFPAFFIVGVRRLMQAADYFSAAATLEASIPLAIALNPELAGNTRIPSRKDYANFRLRAREILTGGREPANTKEKVEERILSQQLLMQSIDSLALRDEIMELGVEASYQNDPTGIGGIFYNSVLAVHQKIVASAEALRERGQAVQESNSPAMLKKADMAARNLMYALAVGARALTGLQFARFAGNKTNELLGMTPIIGLARLAEKDKTRSQRAMIIMDNVVGTAIAVGGIIYAMGLLEDDDDDERRGWRIEGGWDGLTADETRQLRAAGKQPYSIGYLDRQDGTWKNYSYLQWATSGAFATVGNLRDRKRYRPELWSEDNFVGATIAAAAGNGQALMNMSMLQNLNDIFGGNNAYTARDPVQGMATWLNRFASSYAGGFIPRAFKDADYMMDPRHTKANQGIELWLQHVPFYRRGVGEPYLDSLGYQVELRREPWSRAFVETQGTAAHNALSSLVGNGIFISSLNMDNRVVRRGEDVRPMTDAEQKRMMDFYFPALRRYLVTEGPRLERMPMDAAKDKISRDIQNLKSDAQDRAVR
jgi:hypothetical protein